MLGIGLLVCSVIVGRMLLLAGLREVAYNGDDIADVSTTDV